MKNKVFNRKNDITTEDLFSKLDDYLLGDIKAMIHEGDLVSRGIGYPCLITILAGMELLGFVICGNRKQAFNSFWIEFSNIHSKYKSNKLKQLFRRAIRNGIAHNYLTKSGIYVHFQEDKFHLCKVIENGNVGIYISCLALFNDFLVVYEVIKSRLIESPDKAYLSDLKNNLLEGEKYVNSYLNSEDFKKIDNGVIVTEANLTGVSGIGTEYYDSKYISA